MGPDLRGCPEHGLTEWGGVVDKRDGQRRYYCLACRRLRDSRTHYNGERCHKRGHLKTPWTWRLYNGVGRCVPCAYAAAKRRRDALSEAAKAAQAPAREDAA